MTGDKRTIVSAPIRAFRLRDIDDAQNLAMDLEWNDTVLVLEYPRNLASETFTIVCFVEGGPCGLRLCFGSSKERGRFQSNADLWYEYPVGATLALVSQQAFTIRTESIDWSAIDQIAFGGPQQSGALIRFAIYDSKGIQLIASQVATP